MVTHIHFFFQLTLSLLLFSNYPICRELTDPLISKVSEPIAVPTM